jgi:hypothetical protein
VEPAKPAAKRSIPASVKRAAKSGVLSRCHRPGPERNVHSVEASGPASVTVRGSAAVRSAIAALRARVHDSELSERGVYESRYLAVSLESLIPTSVSDRGIRALLARVRRQLSEVPLWSASTRSQPHGDVRNVTAARSRASGRLRGAARVTAGTTASFGVAHSAALIVLGVNVLM